MDERFINELICQLTENLEKVESARQQVENTVQAYETLKTDVGKYTTELSFITQNVRTMISQLEEMKESFLGNISIIIVDEIKTAAASITAVIDGLSAHFSRLEGLAETKTVQINDNLKQRTDFIDSTLNNARVELRNINKQIEKIVINLTQVSNLIQLLKNEEKSHYEAIIRKLEEQENMYNIELEAMSKRNMIFFFVTIIMIVALACIVFIKS